MAQALYQHDIISVLELDRITIEIILNTTERIKNLEITKTLRNKIVASCFFEASTRTRLSFESAVYRQGGHVIGFADATNTSLGKKNESLSDTIRVISNYADAIVIRHPAAGAARLAAEVSSIPIINAGDGSNQHPSQTLQDLFTIRECQQRLEGLHIAFSGDLKYSRTVHSLVQACSLFQCQFYFISPNSLSLPEDFRDFLRTRGARFSFHTSIEEIIPEIDILYMTRLQKERFDSTEFMFVTSQMALDPRWLALAKPNLKILHPLPRQEELPTIIDGMPAAYYFQQATNGVFIRQALLALLLNAEIV